MTSTIRTIGIVRTALRVLVGLGLLFLALADRPAGLIGGLQSYELALGLVGFPAVMVTAGLLGRRYADGPLRFTSTGGLALNTMVIVALFAIPYTAGAAALFYGTSLLIAARRGPGCETTIISNLVLRRDDQIGCPLTSPLDEWETHLRRRSTTCHEQDAKRRSQEQDTRHDASASTPEHCRTSTEMEE